MNSSRRYVFEVRRSIDDETAFFAKMGRFFASATVRRECGGYPLNDGPRYRWFTVRHENNPRVLGFISIEHLADEVRIREGYLRVEARDKGLFRELRNRVLAYIDERGLAARVQALQSNVSLLEPYGFEVQSVRGQWVTLRRNRYAESRTADQSCCSVV